MGRFVSSIIFSLAGILLVTLCVGCASTPEVPIHSDVEFGQGRIAESINIFPLIDCRIDKSVELNYEKLDRVFMKGTVKHYLKKKDYEFEVLTDVSWVSGISADDINYPEESWIRSLGPTNSRYVLLIVLLDVQTENKTFGKGASVEMLGLLVDKSRGVVVWRDKSSKQAGMSGSPLVMVLKNTWYYDGTLLCIGELMESFPKNTSSAD
jgi:hypothetical protein